MRLVSCLFAFVSHIYDKEFIKFIKLGQDIFKLVWFIGGLKSFFFLYLFMVGTATVYKLFFDHPRFHESNLRNP